MIAAIAAYVMWQSQHSFYFIRTFAGSQGQKVAPALFTDDLSCSVWGHGWQFHLLHFFFFPLFEISSWGFTEALCGDFVACCRACRSEEEVLGFFFFVLGFTLLASQGSMVSSTNRDVPEQERDRERYNICNYDIYNFNRNIFTPWGRVNFAKLAFLSRCKSHDKFFEVPFALRLLQGES